MTANTAIKYNYRQGSVDELARSLIVASVLHTDKATFNLPLTAEGARHLGRSLEWAVAMRDTHALREADLAAQAHIVRALNREAADHAEDSGRKLAEAEKTLRTAILYQAGAMLWFVVSLAPWWAGWLA